MAPEIIRERFRAHATFIKPRVLGVAQHKDTGGQAQQRQGGAHPSAAPFTNRHGARVAINASANTPFSAPRAAAPWKAVRSANTAALATAIAGSRSRRATLTSAFRADATALASASILSCFSRS